MNLTGVPITAQEASEYGLVSRVYPAESLVDETVKTADKIASHSKIIVQVNKMNDSLLILLSVHCQYLSLLNLSFRFAKSQLMQPMN